MSKNAQSAVNAAKDSSAPSPIQDVSKEPQSSYAKQIVNSPSLKKTSLKFRREFTNAVTGKRYVECRMRDRKDRKFRVVWSFDLKGEEMRKQALQRKAKGSNSNPEFTPRKRFPRIAPKGSNVQIGDGKPRFPRAPRFPRIKKKIKSKK